MQNIRVVQILWILFCIGLFFTWASLQVFFFPIICRANTFSPISKYAEDPSGFLFLTSKDIIPNSAKFHVIIDGLDQQSDSAHVNVDIDFFCSMIDKNSNNSTFFVLQVLNHISNVSVLVNGDIPENYGEKDNITWSERHSTSYLVIGFPKTNLAGHIDVGIDFTWHGLFWQRSFYGYEIIIPFSNDVWGWIHEVGLPQEVIHEEGILHPDQTSQTLLSVAKPETSTISGTLPNPDLITFYTGRVWYLWDVQKNSNHTLYASTAVVIDTEVNDKKSQYELALALFPLMVGIGVPTMISCGIEFLKLHSKEEGPTK